MPPLYKGKVKDLANLQNQIAKILIFSLFLSIALATITFVALMLIYQQKEKSTIRQLLNDSNSILHAQIASQVGIIANDPDFISFIRSGNITRQKYDTEIRWLFSNLDHNLIKGIKITDNINSNIFSYGNSAKLFVKFKLCYLNRKINSKLGECNHQVLAYLNEREYAKFLNKIDSKIFECNMENCISFQPMNNKDFGIFPVIDNSKYILKVGYKLEKPIFLIFSYIIFILISGTLIFFSHRQLKKLTYSEFIEPLYDITSKLQDSLDINNYKNKYLLEFSYLLDVIHEYQEHKLDIELGKITKQMVHDIRSPISAMEVAFKNIKIKIFTSKDIELLEKSVQSVKHIANSILVRYRNSQINTNQEIPNLIDDENLPRHFLAYKILEEIIVQKESEWINKPCTVRIDADELSKVFWINSPLIEFKRVISNLLNNAYESLTNLSGDIRIISKVIDDKLHLIIQDTGVGVPSDKIDLVMQGYSLKHAGKGLGLLSAQKYFNKLKGTLLFESQLNQGTRITIIIPNHYKPLWYPEVIYYNPKSIFAILDDESTMHMLWQDKLIRLGIQSKHFVNPKDLLVWYRDATLEVKNSIVFLIDFELNNKEYNGLKVIEELKLQKNIYLVTTHAEEAWLQNLINKKNIFLLPKCILGQTQILLN